MCVSGGAPTTISRTLTCSLPRGLAGKGCSVSECLSTSLTTTENKTAWLGAVAQQLEEADLKAGNSGVHSWRAAITTVLASNPNLQCP